MSGSVWWNLTSDNFKKEFFNIGVGLDALNIVLTSVELKFGDAIVSVDFLQN